MAQLQTRDPGSPESIHLTPLRSVRIGKALAAILALSLAILSLLVWLIIRTEKRKYRGSRDSQNELVLHCDAGRLPRRLPPTRQSRTTRPGRRPGQPA